MPETKMIPLVLIDPPLNPMRIDSLGEGLEELIEDIRAHGQLQNIVVVELPGGRYRLVAGSRRCAAFEEAGWPEIRASVYQPGEIDESSAMAAENFHRTQLNPVEEAMFYRDYCNSNGITAKEAARRTHRSYQTVRALLDLLDGDERVMEALRAGEINKAQAQELNLVADEIGRSQALQWARQGFMTAVQLKHWREHREVMGISANIEQVRAELEKIPLVDYRTQTKCQIHNEFVDINVAPPRNICDKCWSVLLDAMEYYADAIQQKQTDHEHQHEDK
jgi:ParB family chromosome partitioning protein